MSDRLIIVGGGGHASVVVDAALSSGKWKVVGFVDPVSADRVMPRMAPFHLGDEAALAKHPGSFGILGFGSIRDFANREKAVERLSSQFTGWAIVVHESAIVSSSAVIGEGTVICAGAIVQPGAKVGNHAVINTGAIVEHDVTIGDYTAVAPGAVIGGGAVIGRRCWIGLGARVRDNITVGDECVVAMGAAVVKDVPRKSVVKGIPAR